MWILLAVGPRRWEVDNILSPESLHGMRCQVLRVWAGGVVLGESVLNGWGHQMRGLLPSDAALTNLWWRTDVIQPLQADLLRNGHLRRVG